MARLLQQAFYCLPDWPLRKRCGGKRMGGENAVENHLVHARKFGRENNRPPLAHLVSVKHQLTDHRPRIAVAAICRRPVCEEKIVALLDS